MTRTTGLGVPCGKCGETVFVYQGDTAPSLDDQIDLTRFTYAVGEKKGKVIKVTDNAAFCPNGCAWTDQERAQTFNPRFWNEIRIDGKPD